MMRIVDTAARKVVGEIQLGEGARPMACAMSSDGKRLYVSNGRAETISVIDTDENKVVGKIKAGTRVWGIGISPDGGILFAANGPSNDVSVIDLGMQKEVSRVKCGEGPWGLCVVKN